MAHQNLHTVEAAALIKNPSTVFPKYHHSPAIRSRIDDISNRANRNEINDKKGRSNMPVNECNVELRNENARSTRKLTAVDVLSVISRPITDSIQDSFGIRNEWSFPNANLTENSYTSNDTNTTLTNIAEEIIETEINYLKDLSIIVFEYVIYVKEIPELFNVIFVPVEDMYNLQSDFYLQLKNSNNDIEKIMNIFLNSEHLFKLYVQFFRNCLERSYILKLYNEKVQELQRRFNDDFKLSDYLIKPIQRLGQYILFFKKIVSILSKNNHSIGKAKKTLKMLHNTMSLGNRDIAVQSILQSPLMSREYGDYLASDDFHITEPAQIESKVFLFSKIIVFTKPIRPNLDQYIYWKSIKTRYLEVEPSKDNKLHLIDSSYRIFKGTDSIRNTFVLDTRSKKTKEQWMFKLNEILQKKPVYKSGSYSNSDIEQENLDPNNNVLNFCIDNIIRDLLNTELRYIHHIGIIITDYKPFLMEKYPEIVNKLLGNIEDIYYGHIKFYNKLKTHRKYISKLIEIFIDEEGLFTLYPVYLKNFSNATLIMTKLRDVLQERRRLQNDQFGLGEYLLRPLQRLGKYLYILEKIIAHLEKQQKSIVNAKKALNIVKSNISLEFSVHSFINSPEKGKDYGRCILANSFTLVDQNDMVVELFLYSDVIVIATKTKNQQFTYKDSIKIRDLEFPYSIDLVLRLVDCGRLFKGLGCKSIFNLKANNREVKILWEREIETILWNQLCKNKKIKGYSSQEDITNITICKGDILVSIECCPTNIALDGKFLTIGNFKVTKNKQPPDHVQVFLLENMIIFTKLLNSSCYYSDSYSFNQVRFLQTERNMLRFTNFDNTIVVMEEIHFKE